MSLSKVVGDGDDNLQQQQKQQKEDRGSVRVWSRLEEQERHLRESTLFFRGLECPLKYGPAINCLQDLIDALHKEFATNYVNIEMVNHIMLSYQSDPAEWRKYAKFDRYTYTRNLVDAGNDKFNLIILCWGEGQLSTIHDHSDSHCFMKMLKGSLREKRYEHPAKKSQNGGDPPFADSMLTKIDERTVGLNEVAYINDNIALHRVENPSHTETAISLHLYCPPFDTCSIFPKATAERVTGKVTFWSVNGVRTNS